MGVFRQELLPHLGRGRVVGQQAGDIDRTIAPKALQPRDVGGIGLADIFVGRIGRKRGVRAPPRSEEHTSELQSLMRISYAVFCLKKKSKTPINNRLYYTSQRKSKDRANTC